MLRILAPVALSAYCAAESCYKPILELKREARNLFFCTTAIVLVLNLSYYYMYMRLVGYIRASTSDQQITLAAQATKIRAMAEVKGFPLIDVIVDSGESAKDLERPGMQRILAMVEAKQIDGLLVAKLDRVTRSVKDLDNLMRLFRAKNVSLISVEESLDMSTATGRMMMNLIGLISQWEREVIGERTKTALQMLKTQGKPCGPPQFGKMYGPKNEDGSHSTEIDNPEEIHTIRVILDLHSKGESYRNIADSMNDAGYRTRRGGIWYFPAVGEIIRKHTAALVAAQPGQLRLAVSAPESDSPPV